MHGKENLEQMFQLAHAYSRMYEAYRANGVIETLDTNDKEFGGAAAPDDWRVLHYLISVPTR